MGYCKAKQNIPSILDPFLLVTERKSQQAAHRVPTAQRVAAWCLRKALDYGGI